MKSDGRICECKGYTTKGMHNDGARHFNPVIALRYDPLHDTLRSLEPLLTRYGVEAKDSKGEDSPRHAIL